MNLSQDLKQIELTVAKLIAKSWSDVRFQTRLINNTAEVLREAGLAIEAIVKVDKAAAPGLQLAINGGYEIVLSAAPSHVADEQLNSLKGTTPFTICGTCGSCYVEL